MRYIQKFAAYYARRCDYFIRCWPDSAGWPLVAWIEQRNLMIKWVICASGVAQVLTKKTFRRLYKVEIMKSHGINGFSARQPGNGRIMRAMLIQITERRYKTLSAACLCGKDGQPKEIIELGCCQRLYIDGIIKTGQLNLQESTVNPRVGGGSIVIVNQRTCEVAATVYYIYYNNII